MPNWGERPDVALENTLDKVLEGLEDEISDNPTFDEVTGIPLNKMIPHATEAIVNIFGPRSGTALEELIQCYAMGFVIGMRFDAYQKKHADDHD